MDVPDPDDIVSFPTEARSVGMPEASRRAFEAHAETALRAEARVETARAEIERVFRSAPDAVVAVSGGKDSMTALALAADADIDHRALHFDWGKRFVPREVEQEIVENIRAYVPDSRLYVASYERATFEPYSDNDHFRRGLHGNGDGEAYEGVGALAGALRYCDEVGTQIVGLRRGESSKRDRGIDGLYGESLGERAAFPLREWSARDVWAYIVANDVPYPGHYDRLACEANDGSPEAYEQARLTTFFDPEFDELAASQMGVAAWDRQDIR